MGLVSATGCWRNAESAALARALDGGLDGELLTGFADRGDILAPGTPIEVYRQQAAGVLGEQRIDAHGMVAFEVGSELVFRGC